VRLLEPNACKTGLEGVVSKVRDSQYPSGRSHDWVKKTCAQLETLTFAGYALDGSRFNALYLRKDNDLIYAGKVDHGFDPAAAKDLQSRMKPLIRKNQPHTKKIAHREFGLHRHCWLRSSIEQSQTRARCAIPFLKASGRTYELGLGSN
jgi:ATP-dependent DNA ligase